SGANLGFAAGANLGSDHARGEVIVFVNPDARVAPGAGAALVGALAELPGAGVAGGGLVDPRGRWEPGAARSGALGAVGRAPGRSGISCSTRRSDACRPGSARAPTRSTGSTARSWQFATISSGGSAASTGPTFSTGRTWISAIAPPRSARGRSTCRPRAPCTVRT